MFIPPSFVHELLNRVDIVDVIDRLVPLKKKGANYGACCPFHNEKTPSFTVSPTKQFYHCFGCSVHGNAINFLMEFSGMSFVEAVTDLAAQVGMQVPVQQKEAQSNGSKTDSQTSLVTEDDVQRYAEERPENLYEVMKLAARFYQGQLKKSEEAVAYLKKRGLTGETAAHFAIGYAPNGWQSLKSVFSNYQSEAGADELIKAGLVIESNDHKYYDRFRDRIIFPILSLKGMIVGFGGRILGSGEPKYLNSPETQLFAKGRELYNFFSARKAIREAERVIVVEGYMDVVALHQHDIKYAVAALGTAITPFHIQKLLRQTDNVIFCFDGDSAGKKAAQRAMENSLPYLIDGKNLSFLFLPEGEDPDSYVHQIGKEAFEGLLQNAIPLSVFLFKSLLVHVDLQTDEGRAKLVRDAKPLLKQVTAPALALMLLKRLSELSSVSQHELEEILQIKRISSSRVRGKAPRPRPITPFRWLIQILLYQPVYFKKLDKSLLVNFEGIHEEEKVLKALIEIFDTYPHIVDETSGSSIMVYFQDNPHRRVLEIIESETLEWDNAIDLEAEFSGALMRIQEMQRKRRMAELHSKSLDTLTIEEKQELKRLAMS
jgi:DNA primase